MLGTIVLVTSLVLVAGVWIAAARIIGTSHQLAQAPAGLSHARLRLQAHGRLLYILAAVLILGATAQWVGAETNRRSDFLEKKRLQLAAFDKSAMWTAPDWTAVDGETEAALIAYGRDLVARTGDYFGEHGLVRPGSVNGLNCQNCHLEAGSKPFGNNYSAVAATYPKVRARSGQSEDIAFRINDCFQRSLNGQPLEADSREMRAMTAYIRWLGSTVPKDQMPKGAGLVDVPLLDRAADPQLGQTVYTIKCASCHGPDGQGLPMPESPRSYPPLWGEHSYAESAGLFRLSRFAGYVKANMPFGATYEAPQLSDEEAWDVAAFVNSQPRPAHRFLDRDWPDIAKKPFDHPFGPYADTFSERQHKYGPFGPLKKK